MQEQKVRWELWKRKRGEEKSQRGGMQGGMKSPQKRSHLSWEIPGTGLRRGGKNSGCWPVQRRGSDVHRTHRAAFAGRGRGLKEAEMQALEAWWHSERGETSHGKYRLYRNM